MGLRYGLTWVRKVTVCNGNFSVIKRVGEKNSPDHAVVLKCQLSLTIPQIE